MFNNPILYLSRIVWRLSIGNRKSVVTYVIFFIIANSLSLLQPLIIAHVLNVIQETGIHSENLWSLIAFLGLFAVQDLFFWMFHGPARVMERKNAFLVRAQYKKNLLSGTMALPMEWHVEHHSGDTIDKIEKGTRALYDFTEHSFQVIEALVRFVGSLIAIALFNLNAIFVVILLVIVALRALATFDRKLVAQYTELNHADNKISAKLFDALSNISTVIILRVEYLLQRDISRAIMKPLRLFVANSKLNEWKWFTASMSAGFLQFLVLGTYTYLTVKSEGSLLVGSLFALYTYTNRINDVFFTFAYLYNDIVRERAAVHNAEEISRVFPLLLKKEKGLYHEWETCDVRNLSFSYGFEERAPLHLDQIALSWRHGEKIALIGESGSGKTTFLKIVRGLYTPATLDLMLDGKRLSDGFLDLKEDIALIPQDPEIFATTIRENITMGVERTDEEIANFVELARFATVVKRLPRGLESSIVEKGVNLSGGEKQRLALARGLMASHDKSILLLDESTSSVDAHNELAIYERIFSQYSDKTIIASVHRLHLLRLFDTIYLFENGAIIARGNFEELLKTSEVFARQWKKYTETKKDIL